MTLEKNATPQGVTLQHTADDSRSGLAPWKESDIRFNIAERRRLVEEQLARFANSASPLTAKDCQLDRSSDSVQLGNDSWQEALPITDRPPSQPYPVNSFPPLIRDAVLEVQHVTQAPMPIVATSAICTMAAASQALIDVERDCHLVGPVSLFSVILGDSGERKSTVDALFSRALKKFHRDSIDLGSDELRSYAANSLAWKAKLDGILAMISAVRRGKKKEGGPSIEDLERDLLTLQKQEPVRPLIPNVLVLDITTEKLAHQLANEWPSCVLIAAEGGMVFGGRSFSKDHQLSTLAAFNALWSNEPLRISRKTSDSFEIQGARLSLSIFVQSQVFADFMSENNLSRAIGFLARCLFAFPDSTQGRRTYKPLPPSLDALDAFEKHVCQLLHISPNIEKRRLHPTKIPLARGAKDLWVEFHDSIEVQLGKGQPLADLRDFGSKAAEIAARVAAVFQASCGFPLAEISQENMRAACDVVNWHIGEVIRYFGPLSPERSRLVADAKKVDLWLVRYCREKAVSAVEISTLLQVGPGPLRKKEKLLRPLEYLASCHRIKWVESCRKIEVNPALLEEAPL